MAFSVEVDQRDASAVVALRGELDIATHAEAEDALTGLEHSGVPLIVLDLRGLSFMDSTGLRLLVQADSRARDAGHRLAIVRGPEAVHRVLEITGLDAKLDLVEDPAEAGAAR